MPELLHNVRFPGETEEYRRARNELLAAEVELRRQSETVAAQRRSLPLGGEVPSDYALEESDGDGDGARTVHLSELFDEGKDTLFLYSFMFRPGPRGLPLEVACPSCTSIIDAVDGEAPHIAAAGKYPSMKGSNGSLRVVFSILVACPVIPAVAADSGFYVGADVGRGSYPRQGHVTLDFPGDTLTSSDLHTHDVAFRLEGGYRFNRYFAADIFSLPSAPR